MVLQFYGSLVLRFSSCMILQFSISPFSSFLACSVVPWFSISDSIVRYFPVSVVPLFSSSIVLCSLAIWFSSPQLP